MDEQPELSELPEGFDKLRARGKVLQAVCRNDVDFLEGIPWGFEEEITLEELNARPYHDQSALITGIANSSIEALLKLFEDCPEVMRSIVNKPSTTVGNTALTLSVLKGWNHVDNEGYSKLAHSHIIKKLIENGANINAKDKFGRTALHYAFLHKNQEAIRYLLEKGASLMEKDLRGISPEGYSDYDYKQAKAIIDETLGKSYKEHYTLEQKNFQTTNKSNQAEQKATPKANQTGESNKDAAKEGGFNKPMRAPLPFYAKKDTENKKSDKVKCHGFATSEDDSEGYNNSDSGEKNSITANPEDNSGGVNDDDSFVP